MSDTNAEHQAWVRKSNLDSALTKLRTYGPARNRDVDFESRKIMLTDDEAMAILEALGALPPLLDV